MKRNNGHKMKESEWVKALEEAKKDPKFMKEIDKFIKATTTIHKLPKP